MEKKTKKNKEKKQIFFDERKQITIFKTQLQRFLPSKIFHGATKTPSGWIQKFLTTMGNYLGNYFWVDYNIFKRRKTLFRKTIEELS